MSPVLAPSELQGPQRTLNSVFDLTKGEVEWYELGRVQVYSERLAANKLAVDRL
jgi:hypothetical protein